MNGMLDPWEDAGTLAGRLSHPNARLFVMIGAELWCEKCRNLRPHFDPLVAQADGSEVWLWLDLEEHAEFLGDYLPDDLPMLVAYQGSKLVACAVLEATVTALDKAIVLLKTEQALRATISDPGIRARLLQQDWAN